MKFKKGDKVRVLINYKSYKKGDITKVSGVPSTGYYVGGYSVKDVDSMNHLFLIDELELVDDKKQEFKHIVHCPTEKEYKEVLQWLEDNTDIKWCYNGGSPTKKNHWNGKDSKLQIEDVIYNGNHIRKESPICETKKFCTAREFLCSVRNEPLDELELTGFENGSTDETYTTQQEIDGDKFEIRASGKNIKDIKIVKYKINKPNNKIMSKVLKRIKDIGLSADEKLLRKHGMHNEDGNLTSTCQEALCLLEAKERKFKSWSEFQISLGFADHRDVDLSAIELADLYEKHETALLEIVKDQDKEDKSKKK